MKDSGYIILDFIWNVWCKIVDGVFQGFLWGIGIALALRWLGVLPL